MYLIKMIGIFILGGFVGLSIMAVLSFSGTGESKINEDSSAKNNNQISDEIKEKIAG